MKFGTTTARIIPKSLFDHYFYFPVTKIELKKASEPLSKYAQKARKDPVIVVKKGKPFAAVVPIRNADEETVSLSTNRKFLAIIERSRSRTKKEGAISSKELRRRLGLKK